MEVHNCKDVGCSFYGNIFFFIMTGRNPSGSHRGARKSFCLCRSPGIITGTYQRRNGSCSILRCWPVTVHRGFRGFANCNHSSLRVHLSTFRVSSTTCHLPAATDPPQTTGSLERSGGMTERPHDQFFSR